jgi:TRAP-type mannitol/chloroaromatic compound transport system permease large subunit
MNGLVLLGRTIVFVTPSRPTIVIVPGTGAVGVAGTPTVAGAVGAVGAAGAVCVCM